jgi:hypothetical protein
MQRQKVLITTMRPALTAFLAFLLISLCPCGIHAQSASADSKAPLPLSALTPDQWRQDLEIAKDTFLTRDRSFTPQARQLFLDSISRLENSLQSKTYQQIVVELASAVALSGNAHTRIYLLRNRTELARFPIRVWWFSDGLYVIKATREYADLLGAKVLAIGGRSPEKVKQAVKPLYSGNPSWSDYISDYTMTSPDILYGLGLIRSEREARIKFRKRDSRLTERTIGALPFHKSDQPVESWWDLSPLHPGTGGPWLSVLPVDAAKLPLYLRNPLTYYWSEYLPDQKLLYFQYNRAGNMPTGESLADFGKQLLSQIQNSKPREIAVDLRFNTGGNLDVARSLMQQLGSVANENQIKLFVITSRTTFSAGITHASQLREAGAIVVGEPVGDELDFWAEGGNILLPNSKLTLHYADRFHSYSWIERPEVKPYMALDLSVDTLQPQNLVRLSFRDYLAGRDPALAAIEGSTRKAKR